MGVQPMTTATPNQQRFIVGWLTRHGKPAYRNVKSICEVERDKPITRLTCREASRLIDWMKQLEAAR